MYDTVLSLAVCVVWKRSTLERLASPNSANCSNKRQTANSGLVRWLIKGENCLFCMGEMVNLTGLIEHN